MHFDELKDKALTLPLSPGVYIMKDKEDRVIYVGKAKKLKNRVCQYFQNTANHTPKTRMMVSKIDHFDVIIAASEFEALVLECSLIKRHQPKYNILLKDDKGYPYLRVDMRKDFPVITMVSRVTDDGASYYGPFGSRGVTQDILELILQTLKLPACSKQFPRDLGKGRVCLNYHMNHCSGWCTGKCSKEEYRDRLEQARQLLLGNFRSVADQIKCQMLQAADELNFELAASLRDRLASVEALGKKQLVTAGALADTDVVGFAQTETKSCFTVMHYRGGNLLDKDMEILSVQEDPAAAICALIKQYYLSRGFAPKYVLLPCAVEDASLFEELLLERYGKKTRIKTPQRGDDLRLVELAVKNAREEAERVTDKEDRIRANLQILSKMLGVPQASRIESFDISNLSGTDIVAGMVVFQDGKPRRSAYRHFKIEGLLDADDYASMRQVVTRRFREYLDKGKGFEELPDLLLIDGGAVHAAIAAEVLCELGLGIPVFGMVKDDRHRTRALVTPEGQEIRIDNRQSIFALIGNIQEETHRFAITYHKKLRSKRLRYSELDSIPGIGPRRKESLLKIYKSLSAMAAAELSDLERHLPKDAALAVYRHFEKNRKGEN